MSKFLLNNERRKNIIILLHHLIYSAPYPDEYHNTINKIYHIIKGYVSHKYPQDEMKVLAKYGAAHALGIYLPYRNTKHNLQVNSNTRCSSINYDILGLIFPHIFTSEKDDRDIYRFFNLKTANWDLPKYTECLRLNTIEASIEVGHEDYSEFTKQHKNINDILDNIDKTFNDYTKLILAAKSFDFLVEVNPSFEKYRKDIFNNNVKKIQVHKSSAVIDKPKVDNNCIINEDHVKRLIENPIVF